MFLQKLFNVNKFSRVELFIAIVLSFIFIAASVAAYFIMKDSFSYDISSIVMDYPVEKDYIDV